LEPWDDPHNADAAFQRARLRHEVLPLLEDVLHGGVAEALARTAELVQDDLDALDALTPPAMITHELRENREFVRDHRVEVAALVGLPRALRTRALRQWLAAAGVPPVTSAHLGALDALVGDWHGQGPVDLPGGLRVRRASGRLEIVLPSDERQEHPDRV